ncbi:MAG: restriction endonuclease [Propionicimonas sp.]|uniref:restriction endonuclease n=1 Tax=Propionicimonas sp. TaxID=1955623 RepID=UPI003D1029A4
MSEQAGSPGSPQPHANPTTSPNSLGQDWLRQLDWRQFEDLVGSAYRLQGYAVLPTSPGADGGIDLILTRGSERIFVQCKHWKEWQVGAPVIRELFGLVAANRATRGIVVTSGTFSREAIEFGRQTGTELLDGPAVMALVASGNAYRPVGAPRPDFPSPAFTPPTAPSFGPPTPRSVPSCPVCLSPMVLHKARRGPHAGSLFWGCGRYPGCRGTREAAAGTALPPTPRQVARERKRRRSLIVALAALVIGPILFLTSTAFAMHAITHPASFPTSRILPSTPVAGPAASTSTNTPTGTLRMGEQPMDVAVDTKSKRLYTANYVSGDATVIDAASMSVLDTIDVPGKPVGIAVSGNTLYVADRAGKKVYAINLKTHKTTATFAAGRGPSDLALDAEAGRLFIAHEDGSVWTYSLSSGRRLSKVDAYPGVSIAVDTAEHKLYAVNVSGVLYTFRTRTLQRVSVAFVGAGAIATDSKRQRLYVAHGQQLREYNVLTGTSQPIELDIDAQSVAVDPTTRTAYVADPDTNAVRAVSLK